MNSRTNGIVVGGVVAPGTERVVRSPAAWWGAEDFGARDRQGTTIDQIVDHWTGGALLTGPEAGATCVARMRARKKKDGSGPLEVGAHFLIAADGVVHQLADVIDATVHVGHRLTIRRSIGLERAWPGTAKQAGKLGIRLPTVRGVARGQVVRCAEPPAAIVEASIWLVDTLMRLVPTIPRVRGRFGVPGVIEHADMPVTKGGTIKVDCAGLFFPHYLRARVIR